MRINAEQKNGNIQVEAKAAFIICKDVNSEPGSAGFVLGDTNGTDLLGFDSSMCRKAYPGTEFREPETEQCPYQFLFRGSKKHVL